MNTLEGWQSSLIKEQCSEFLQQSAGQPILKCFPSKYNTFQKVKIRKRKGDLFDETFNEAFEPHELRQRALFANGASTIEDAPPEFEPFFIFPINGFKFLYNKSVLNSSDEYRQVFDILINQLDQGRGEKIFIDMLQFTYKNVDLSEGITSGSEIIVYDIPFVYTIKQSGVVDYPKLLAEIS